METATTNPADIRIDFSDYIGEPLSEVPVAFLKWNLQRNRHLKPEMREAIRAVIALQDACRLPAGRRDVFIDVKSIKPGERVVVNGKIGNFFKDEVCVVLAPVARNVITIQPVDSSLAVRHVLPMAILRKA